MLIVSVDAIQNRYLHYKFSICDLQSYHMLSGAYLKSLWTFLQLEICGVEFTGR